MTGRRRRVLSGLLEEVRRRLRRVAEPARAAGAQAYMKSAMPFLGVSAVPLRQVCRDVFGRSHSPDRPPGGATVRELWRGARYREERYAAIELAGVTRGRAFQDLDALPLYEEMIVTGAWWDYVDALAENARGHAAAAHPEAHAQDHARAGAATEDMWKRRSVDPLPARDSRRTPTSSCCTPASSLRSRRRSSSCARRSAGRCASTRGPTGAVVRYVRANEARLSGLSKREALKNVRRASPRRADPGRAEVVARRPSDRGSAGLHWTYGDLVRCPAYGISRACRPAGV